VRKSYYFVAVLFLIILVIQIRGYSITSFNSGGHGDFEWFLAKLLSLIFGVAFAIVIPLPLPDIRARFLLRHLIAIGAIVGTFLLTELLAPFAFKATYPVFCNWDSNSPMLCYNCASAKGLSQEETWHQCGG
jgi:hypothetical protein